MKTTFPIVPEEAVAIPVRAGIVTLSNGKKVANFSSPHPFKFTDGTVLPAVSEEFSRKYSIVFNEETDTDGDVNLTFELTAPVLERVQEFIRLWAHRQVDVVFCPLPMITAMKEKKFNIKNSPFRTVRIEDRVQKLVSTEKQCL